MPTIPLYRSLSFQEQLEDNLSFYTTPSTTPDQNLFLTHREIAIARYALSSQAAAYAKAIEIFTDLLDQKANCTDAKTLTDIMVLIASIEAKSTALINSVRQVTELLGKAVSIDVNKAALQNMLINLPSLVEKTICTVSGDISLAERVKIGLNNQISEMMIALRFEGGESLTQKDNDFNLAYEQYLGMIDSVPTQP